MADALEEIASSRDTYGFASGAVYCFWRVGSREILYLGRAVDLPERFAQHNGLRGTALGSKRNEIEAHFAESDELGFSVLVRSPYFQTPVARHLHQVEADFGPIDDESWDELWKEPRTETELEIAHAEGIGLKSYLLAHGQLPPWNRIGGEMSVWGAEMNRPDSTGELMTGTVDHLLQARRTITELASDATAAHFESGVLQLARSRAVRHGMFANEQLSDYQILAALDQLTDEYSAADTQRIREAGYLLTRCRLSDPPTQAVTELRSAWSEGRALPVWGPTPPLR